MDKSKRHLAWWVVGLLAVAAIVAWWLLRPAGVPEGFAVSNGRIEATEVDIASKIAGRIDTILVKEGQFVREGEVLAKMDIPLFISAFRRANDLAMAMEARCYRGGEGRTKMKPLIYHKRDYIAYGCIVAYMVISIVVGRLPFLP